jgi:hypothetical protein
MHHEDLEGNVAKVSDRPQRFKGKVMFSDPRQEKFVSPAEQRILKGTAWPDGMKKFHIEGHVMLAKVEDSTVFFNSKFESANLRQVFKANESEGPPKSDEIQQPRP